jgi:hypothetical protein
MFQDEVAKLWFVTAVSNTPRYRIRYHLYERFRKHLVEELGARLITVESAFGDRDFVVTAHPPKCPEREIHVRVRHTTEIWVKESLLNVGLSRLPDVAKYIAWIDADVRFLKEDILAELVHQLQHYSVVQPFSHCIDLDANGGVMQVHRSFMSCYVEEMPFWIPSEDPSSSYDQRLNRAWHPGYCMAFRRRPLEMVGGLFEYGVAGAGDFHMAMGLIGEAEHTIYVGVSDGYAKAVLAWQEKALRYFERDCGYVPGTIAHAYHGPKKNRSYQERWRILVENDFDPFVDLRRSLQGVLELHTRKWKLRDDLRKYFLRRSEDFLRVSYG